ncbi:hypothetical protein OIU84_000581 [Salix udensis]|uniref:Uncharacterized protein n=1 Tax=Salix udensis TaxID=889485 RepID=A0AAD6PMI4_9ROSI|nr:hypothetical protein OIU84_000581 [Salix udensis]
MQNFATGEVPDHGGSENGPALNRSASRFSGIDKTVIESLPFFRFTSLKGSREGLECAVCLSKFEDIEILRLLPKSCDTWGIHRSCEMTRTWSCLSGGRKDRQGSSRFSVGSSFRKGGNVSVEEELLIREEVEGSDNDRKIFNKFKHRIIVSEIALKNRWSSASSSDLMFLNSEMLHDMSSNRFHTLDMDEEESTDNRGREDEKVLKIKEEIEVKRLLESKVSPVSRNSPISIQGQPSTSGSKGSSGQTSRIVDSAGRRSVSEITAFSRFRSFGLKNSINRVSSSDGSNVQADRQRQLWLPIARRTVQWFANRERRDQQNESTRHAPDV